VLTMQDGAKASTLHEIELRRATRAVVDADKQRISAHNSRSGVWWAEKQRKNEE